MVVLHLFVATLCHFVSHLNDFPTRNVKSLQSEALIPWAHGPVPDSPMVDEHAKKQEV